MKRGVSADWDYQGVFLLSPILPVVWLVIDENGELWCSPFSSAFCSGLFPVGSLGFQESTVLNEVIGKDFLVLDVLVLGIGSAEDIILVRTLQPVVHVHLTVNVIIDPATQVYRQIPVLPAESMVHGDNGLRDGVADEILVPSDPIICEPESGTFSFEVSANISYDVTTDVSWLKQVVGRGMERSTLHFSVEENTGSAMREGNIILSGNGVERTVKVMQKGKEEAPYLIVSQEHFNILPEGGTVRFTVKANVPYRVNTDADWMVQAVSGSSDEIVFTVSANESTSSREATITVTSEDGNLVRTVQVVQEGEAVYLDVSPSFLSLTSSSQTISLQVETNTHYRLSSDASWLVCDMTGLGNWSNPSFTVSVNESTSSREATITVTSEDGSLVRTVQVVQKGEAVYLDVSPSNISATAEGGKFTFTVNSNTQYTFTCSDNSWISVDGNLIVIGANTSTSQRKGNVTVRAAELVRVIEITQAGKKEETPSAGGSIEDFTENEEDW